MLLEAHGEVLVRVWEAGAKLADRGTARVYALTRQDTQASNAMVTGNLVVCSFDAHVLFDPGSTHSYVSPLFAKSFTKELVDLERLFLVATLTGETILVRDGYHSCSVVVSELEAVANFLLDMTEFKVIMGMD